MADTRSYARITRTDLKRLLRLAQDERDDFFTRHPEWAILYRKRILCAALGGDGALHYLNGITGVSEFQVWTFYAENSRGSLPPSPHLAPRLRRVEIWPQRRPTGELQGAAGRAAGALAGCPAGDDPLEALQRYLKARASPSARELSSKAVVLLEPDEFLGVEAWPSLVLPPRR